MTYVLAIDNGSQSTKVTIVDEHGRVHASAQRPLRPYEHPAPGQVVHPGDDLWDSVAATCREVLDRWAGDRRDITAVGLCTIRFCRALLDADGALVEPVMSWMDERVARPHVADPRVRWVTTSSGHLTHRLTGRFVDTAASYRGVWPVDVATTRWSQDPEAFRATGMPREMLFDLVDPGDLLGPVTAAAARATGLPEGVPLYATANDKAVEALGCGVHGPETVLLSLGTYVAAMTVGERVVDDPTGALWTNFASVPGEYLYESAGIRRGMWTVSWVTDVLRGDVAELGAGAKDVPIGSGGLVTVPDWLAPVDHPHRRGAVLGFDGTQGRHHMFRSVLESVAITMHRHVEAMEKALGHRADTLLVSGGGARSDLMMQIAADVFDRPTARPAVADAAGLGAAICAAVGAGVHPDWDTAVATMVDAPQPFTPRGEAVREYAAVRERHGRLVELIDPVFVAVYGA